MWRYNNWTNQSQTGKSVSKAYVYLRHLREFLKMRSNFIFVIFIFLIGCSSRDIELKNRTVVNNGKIINIKRIPFQGYFYISKKTFHFYKNDVDTILNNNLIKKIKHDKQFKFINYYLLRSKIGRRCGKRPKSKGMYLVPILRNKRYDIYPINDSILEFTMVKKKNNKKYFIYTLDYMQTPIDSIINCLTNH